MRVDLSSHELLHDLVRELTQVRCLVRPLGAGSCLVSVLDAEGLDEALCELTFFVRAWASLHPGVVATVTG